MTQDPNIGRTIGGAFEIMRKLGQGGFGAVYLAQQTLDTHHRTVALKLGKPAMDADPAIIKRFLREARALDVIQSRHVCRVYDTGYLDDGSVFIAMEYVDGITLHQLLHDQAPLAPARAVGLAIQILEVLVEAHGLSEPILHRDLKPANIMIRRAPGGREHVFVLDFGIAKILHLAGGDETLATAQGMMVGSPNYAAPERATGQEDPRGDLYSLGVILFEMLTGRNPFKRDLPTAALVAHLREPVPDDMARLDIPPAIQAVVLAALEKTPDGRPETADAMLEALQRSLGQSTTATLAWTRGDAPDPPASSDICGVLPEEDEAPSAPRPMTILFAALIGIALGAALLLLLRSAEDPSAAAGRPSVDTAAASLDAALKPAPPDATVPQAQKDASPAPEDAAVRAPASAKGQGVASPKPVTKTRPRQPGSAIGRPATRGRSPGKRTTRPARIKRSHSPPKIVLPP